MPQLDLKILAYYPFWHINQTVNEHSNRDFGLRSFQLLLGKSVWIQERLKTQSGEESSSSGCFNPVGRLQQSVRTSLNRINNYKLMRIYIIMVIIVKTSTAIWWINKFGR